MSKENRDAIDFKLAESISMATKEGDWKDFDTVTLFAPKASNKKQAALIKNFAGITFKSLSSDMTEEQKNQAIEKVEEQKNSNKNKEEDRLTGKDFAQIAAMNGVDDDKFDRALDAFKHLVTKGDCAEIDGNDLTSDLFDDLSYDDMEAMFYQYAISFLLRSLLS